MAEPITHGLKMDELFDEITHVIKNHFTKNMSEFMKRYELLEETHRQLMRLPSIANEFQRHNINIKDTKNTQEDYNIDEFILKLSTKLSEICGNQLSEIGPVLNKILEFVDKKNLEEPKKEDIVKASITTACENENIKIIIKEDAETKASEEVYIPPSVLSDGEDEEDEEEEDEDEEEDEEEEEEEEEDEDEESDEEEEEETVLDQKIEEDEVETEAEEEEDEEEEDEADLDQPFEKVEEADLDQKVEEEEVSPTILAPPFEKVEEEELFEIEIDDVTYCTNNDETGFIYELSEDGDVGEKVGYFKDSEPFFYADE
jgi:cobalamin biosynthesis protein CobT